MGVPIILALNLAAAPVDLAIVRSRRGSAGLKLVLTLGGTGDPIYQGGAVRVVGFTHSYQQYQRRSPHKPGFHVEDMRRN